MDCLQQDNQETLKEELGDLLLATVTLCIYLKHDPEKSLSNALQKFEGRFRKVEEVFKNENKNMKNASLEELLNAWKRAKNDR